MRLKQKLFRDPALKEQYALAMEEMQLKGYSETVPDNELSRDDGKVWFIPHHAVRHPRKPDKVRPVFNCPF